MSNNAGGGYQSYVYPEWSTIVGWFIFIICLIPIPLVYVMTYIREYRSIDSEEVKSIIPDSQEYLVDDNYYSMKPRYLEALNRTNLPRNDWGPMKSVNHYGLYKHLSDSSQSLNDDNNYFEENLNNESP
jgi:hypothetical protein